MPHKSPPSPRAPSDPSRIADALVVVSCAYTALETGERFGLLDREQSLYRRLWPSFRTVVFVSYGDEKDHAVASGLVPGMLGQVWCVCNDRRQEPGTFLAGVPDKVAHLLQGGGHSSALVLTEQHWGGDVAVCITRALRASGIRTGLCARTGYHWSWTMAREHGTQSTQFAQARYLEGELCAAADIVIATTPAIADALAFQHALPHDRLRIVPNYVLTDEPVPAFDSRTPGLILTAGRLSREKRVHLLIEACAGLREPLRSTARLLIVGQGPEENALRTLAARLQVTAEFRPRVPHRDLLSLMRSCSVYAQCSEYEGHPKTVIEAMASGSPVLVARAPGLADHVTHGETGLIAAPDAESLAAALTSLLANPDASSRLGAAAAAHTRATLGFDTIFPFYREACAQAALAAGAGRTLPPAIVRWDQPLLHLPADAAATTWVASLDAYAKRLEPAARDVFLRGLSLRLGQSHSRVLPATAH
jgi:glycosyltransferase involved in cell wall biosynthesis